MLREAFVFGMLVLAGQVADAPRTTAPVPEKVEVCEVARSGAKFSGRYVELTGKVAGLDPKHLLLTSDDCMLGVKLDFSPEVQGHDDVRVLFAALKRTASGTSDSGITGTFEGNYLYAGDGAEVGLQVEGIDALQFPKR